MNHRRREVAGPKLVAAVHGFAPDALVAATCGPAEFLGIADETGTIEPGKAADLGLEADPLEDIRNTRRIAGVVRAGTYLEGAALDSLAAEVARRAWAGAEGATAEDGAVDNSAADDGA